ncbi:carbohydrate-binding protein [Kitasatospora sp. MAP5-34]|uniref:carbohydrate-binding protein n=1 Tax=Kitasatospora sp. MAP5-34 TaxID=3035102 RepID=UPI002473B649|nr:carbohydrate-binding protein [Kitasatospora sp. MAP5-34]MDH6577114.1 chitodextrinase [Kitasatospora sp. MAP5-34]
MSASPSSSSSTPSGTCTAPSWSATTAYATTGTQASWRGHNYTNKWWTTGEDPTIIGAWGVRNDLGVC